jgi:hypothetical protein
MIALLTFLAAISLLASMRNSTAAALPCEAACMSRVLVPGSLITESPAARKALMQSMCPPLTAYSRGLALL